MTVTEETSEIQQVAVKDLFWLVTAVAAVLAYAKSWGDSTVYQAVLYLLMVVVIGSTIGFFARQVRESLFWSAITTLIAFIAVAGGNLPSYGVSLGWGVVGAICGGLAGSRVPPSLWLGSLVSGCMAVLSMLATVVCLGEPISGLITFDVACAGVMGLAIRPFLQFLQRLEEGTKQPRIVLACWLTLVFLLGNFLVPIVGGVTR